MLKTLTDMTTPELVQKAERLRTNWDRACFFSDWAERRANIEKLMERVAVEIVRRDNAARAAAVEVNSDEAQTALIRDFTKGVADGQDAAGDAIDRAIPFNGSLGEANARGIAYDSVYGRGFRCGYGELISLTYPTGILVDDAGYIVREA